MASMVDVGSVIVSVLAVVGIISLLRMWGDRIASGHAPIKALLGCDDDVAKVVLAYTRAKGMPFSQLHSLVTVAKGYFLPLYGRVLDNRPVAVSREVNGAVIAATARGRYDAGTTNDEFLKIIAEELVHFRHQESPLTQPVRDMDGLIF